MAKAKTDQFEINRMVRYTREQEEEFVLVAQEMGLRGAMRELGYPGSYNTASKWFTSRQLEMPNVSTLHQHAANMKAHYTHEEELAGVELLMDRYTEKMMHEDLTPDELNKLANGYERLIKTKRLIEGKSTGITETQSYDGTDLEIAKLTAEMEQRNDEYAATQVTGQ